LAWFIKFGLGGWLLSACVTHASSLFKPDAIPSPRHFHPSPNR